MDIPTLLLKHNNEEIIERLIEIYPDQKKSVRGYMKVIDTLRTLEPSGRDEMKIDVYHITCEDDEDYDRVSGIIEGEDMGYALEFTPWSHWLGMSFTEESLKYPEVDLIAHCLWEMTWSGFEEEQIQEKIDSMIETVKKIEEDHDAKRIS